MSIFDRFFGQKDSASPAAGGLVANTELQDAPCLQLLFDRSLRLDAKAAEQQLRSYHPALKAARLEEVIAGLAEKGGWFGLAGWGKHVIRLVGFNFQMPADVVEECVAPSHYADKFGEQARAHRSHLLLYYAGYEESTLEQYVALAAVAGVLSSFGATVVLNESAHTSFPAKALSGANTDGDLLELLRTLPLLMLYCGFVKYDVEGVKGVWMRTYGAHLFGLPDFAALAAGHHEGERYFDIFGSILAYLETSGAEMESGHTMQIGEEEFLRLRDPAEGEDWLESEGELFVVEVIGPEEINRPTAHGSPEPPKDAWYQDAARSREEALA